MDPSPISPNASRHGRSKHGGSVAKSNKRGRGYSVVDDREALISKALTFVLKRTVDEDAEQAEGEEKLVADHEGWVDCEDVVSSKCYFLAPKNQDANTQPSSRAPTSPPSKSRSPSSNPSPSPPNPASRSRPPPTPRKPTKTTPQTTSSACCPMYHKPRPQPRRTSSHPSRSPPKTCPTSSSTSAPTPPTP